MTDCIIIGAGVIGLSLAWELAQRGVKVRILDRASAGKEASWAGAGILPPANLKTAIHPLEKLRGLSHRLHPAWAEKLRRETGIDTGFRPCGGLYLAASRGEAASLAGMAAFWETEQVECRRLDLREAGALEPALLETLASGSIHSVYLLPGESQLRNTRHLQALYEACRKRGVEVLENEAAVSFELSQGKLQSVKTNRRTLTADAYCVTSGAWTQQLLLRLGIESGILPVRGQMVLYRCDRPPFVHILNSGSRYLVPRDDGRVLAGSTEEEVGFQKETTEAGIADIRGMAESLVPQLRSAEIEQSWAGFRPGTFDGLPYLGKVEGLENLFIAAGHFRSGIFLSPATAVVLSQFICGETPQVDLSPFRPTRG